MCSGPSWGMSEDDPLEAGRFDGGCEMARDVREEDGTAESVVEAIVSRIEFLVGGVARHIL